jgi:6-phosphogluconate dehydrogenase (decarboxylating)
MQLGLIGLGRMGATMVRGYQLPAEIIQPKEGKVLWLVDPSAAAMLAPQAKRAF